MEISRPGKYVFQNLGYQHYLENLGKRCVFDKNSLAKSVNDIFMIVCVPLK